MRESKHMMAQENTLLPSQLDRSCIVLDGPNISGAPSGKTCAFQAAIQHQNRAIGCSNIRTAAM
jgi:hypothetical protein